MRTWPKLDLIIPYQQRNDPLLLDLLRSIDQQDYPKHRLVTHLISRGNSEEAKAYGILKCQGDIIGLLCSDNRLPRRDFLKHMARDASHPDVVGAYPARYTYLKSDPPLNRYFALLGANDPLCWAIGKSDRDSYLDFPYPKQIREFAHHIPSIGDNGLFVKRKLLQQVVKSPQRHFCIDAMEDLRRRGHYRYIINQQTLHHRTGLSLLAYFKRRYRYVTELYWNVLPKRRWVMVESLDDWRGVLDFALTSLLILPTCWFAYLASKKIPDRAWWYHPVVCFGLTLIYGWAWLCHTCRSLFRASIGKRS